MKIGFSTFKSLRSGSRMKRMKKKIKEKSFGGKKRWEMKNWGKFCAAIKKFGGKHIATFYGTCLCNTWIN